MKQLFLWFILVLMLFVCTSVTAQRVKRKGVTPVNVSKNQKTDSTKYKYTIEQLNGKWQEIKRTAGNKTIMPITDTIYLWFKEENKVETKDGAKTYLRGEAVIDPPGNILIAAADVYTIISVGNDELVLDDPDKIRHTFKKTNQFWHETLGKKPVQHESFGNPVTPTIAGITGNWSVYRRQSKPGAVTANTMLIKRLKISTATSDQTASGEITCYSNEKSETLPCTVTINGSNMIIEAGNYNWRFPVYKADGKELVFGDMGKLVYYAKTL
jgi:large exoprotein involved in heme utilization and adhesion